VLNLVFHQNLILPCFKHFKFHLSFSISHLNPKFVLLNLHFSSIPTLKLLVSRHHLYVLLEGPAPILSLNHQFIIAIINLLKQALSC
jgi:hypothetical protein